MANRTNLTGPSERTESAIDPRGGGKLKNAIGHDMKPLEPHPGNSPAQNLGIGKGGLGHATDASVPGSNPLEPEPPLKALHTQPPAPIKQGMRNRNDDPLN